MSEVRAPALGMEPTREVAAMGARRVRRIVVGLCTVRNAIYIYTLYTP